MKLGTSGVPVAHHRPIRGQNEVTIPGKLFTWLPGLQGAICEPTLTQNTYNENVEHHRKHKLVNNYPYKLPHLVSLSKIVRILQQQPSYASQVARGLAQCAFATF